MAARCRPTWRRWSKLPGVGRKTANVVLGHALGVPGLPVDRHVLRVANRLGLVKNDDPVKVEAQLCAMLPPERWTRLRHADPARPPHLPAEAAVPALQRAARLRFLSHGHRDEAASSEAVVLKAAKQPSRRSRRKAREAR